MITLILVCITLILVWAAYRIIRKTTSNRTSIIITSFLVLILSYFLFANFHPTTQFYLDDYRENTSIKLPDSAELINKRSSSSFGDYNISYAVRLTPSDYTLTYNKLLEKGFQENTTYLETSENDFLLSQISNVGIANILVKDYRYKNYEILFMEDGRTIVCNSNKW
ncbi:hypothetical protein SAMN05444128_3794 [Pontibacter indicus]|uniref:Uncharacterized protein n=1 Tax=Pontibacter indicus TaxID=1317125 RepID=A0A1R3XSI3_9BACT|nr:hypothetical protein SAMN05444128_3794 [Pontibacter indicus]